MPSKDTPKQSPKLRSISLNAEQRKHSAKMALVAQTPQEAALLADFRLMNEKDQLFIARCVDDFASDNKPGKPALCLVSGGRPQ